MATKSNHGGKRPGAGRPKGSGKYKEPTVALRVPQSLEVSIKALINNYRSVSANSEMEEMLTEDYATAVNFDPMVDFDNLPSNVIPMFGYKISAGVPSFTDDFIDDGVDLLEFLIRNPEATFLVKVAGDSMINAGIFSDDLLIVDSKIGPVHGSIVVAVIDGDLTVKRLYKRQGQVKLLPDNPSFNPIEITTDMDFSISGVVTNVIHTFW